ncbi:H-NS family nucleoid-associated regulatory protein [Paraburkholderia aromaticivorans]|uniref:H-NS family nucleoid-associated regulatory protein n=1 Tax=Paraburkholderia aromaticivorans TaxID=2026199 RepID=UPI001456214D|nr:H-NS family nucleoid-associated regulatory protein [Paraburkholderia aromaticivorans]
MNGTSIESKLAKLTKRIDEEHARFIAATKVSVTGVPAEYGLTRDDLTAIKLIKQLAKTMEKQDANLVKTAKKTTRKGVRSGPQPAKYRDFESGATWSGLARVPARIAGGGPHSVPD